MTDLEKRVENLEKLSDFSIDIIKKMLWIDKGGYYKDDYANDLKKLVKLKEEIYRKEDKCQ